MTINSGSYDVNDYLGQSSTDLTGRTISFDVTDDFQEYTVCHGMYVDCDTGIYKKLIFNAAGYKPTGWSLYSSDGVNFSYSYYGTSGRSDAYHLALSGLSVVYSNRFVDTYGEYDTNFVASVPIPGSLWLFGSSLLGLIVDGRCKVRG